jgi:hypothetical protein
MGMNIECMFYLQERGYLTADKNKLLDIGPQNVHNCTAQQVRDFALRQGITVAAEVLDKEAKRLAYFSTPRPEERTTLFSEIAELTNIEYHAFDVCPAPKTELLDLNFDTLPVRHRELYDVVLNFGTTEHIFNQWNCFALIHDATKVGGIIYCVLPATGYLDHGYFCYTPLFFKDIARANNYEIVDRFFSPGSGINVITRFGLDLRADGKFRQRDSGVIDPGQENITCFNMHFVMRKTRNAPFRCELEIATTHSPVDRAMARRYQNNVTGQLDKTRAILQSTSGVEDALAQRDQALAEWRRLKGEVEQIYGSRSWRLTAPLRALGAALRRG